MRKLFIIILAFSLAIAADAQVSVRRTPKKEKTEVAKKPAKKTQPAKAAETKPAEVKSMTSRGLTDNEHDSFDAATDVKQPASTPAAIKAEAPVAVKKSAEQRKITTRREAPSQANNVTLRRQLFESAQPTSSPNARWQHVVYRELDLEVDANSALYYPQEPVDGLTNFFQIIFEAVAKGDLKAYEFLDGREVFTDQYLINIADVLETHDISATRTGDKNGRPTFEVKQADIPSYLVMTYYIKEKWEVDRNTSQYGPRILAICPVINKPGDYGSSTVRYPLFWIDYNDLRPFISSQLIMTSGMNTATRYTIDDYFTLGLYDGQIYKVQNPRGLTLMQQYPDTAQLRLKREEIEAQLHSFGQSIYPKEEEVKEEAAAQEEKTEAKKTEAEAEAADVSVPEETITATASTTATKTNRRTKTAAKPKAQKTPKARSVRR